MALIMEYCPSTLQQWIKNRNDETPVIENRKTPLEYFDMICQGLKYVHGEGLFHRDLKPSNLLLTSQNIIRIADFGLAREENFDEIYTTGVGTDLYRPPEQKTNKYGHHVDLYSLGEKNIY